MADNNINISPEMINNIMNILKNNTETTTNTNNSENKSSNNSNNENNMSSELNSNQAGSNNDFNFDIETMMKIKSIMETLNTKNDPRSNLLYSLKPYLRKGKQSKLDQYANLLKITQVSNLFKNEKGEQK